MKFKTKEISTERREHMQKNSGTEKGRNEIGKVESN